MAYRIERVDSGRMERRFLDFPRKLYRDDPHYVQPFDKEVRAAFDRKVNPYFGHGDARRWIALDARGKTVGRIAAFYDRNKDGAEEVRNGGCGYFECIDSREVAALLFDSAREWLSGKGYEAMDGPINFGENDTNWGLLVQGEGPPTLGMTYNPPYYRQLFEDYGFRLYYRQFSFELDVQKPFPERFWKIAEWINKREGYSWKHFDPKHTAKFVQDTVSIYNEAWSRMREDYTPMDPGSLYDELRKIRAIMDPEMIWYAYFKGRPIAFFMFLPDANQIFRHLNGRLHLINKLRFLHYKRKGTITRARGTAAGVVPKFQNSGVESGIIWQLNEKVKHKPWLKHIELSWSGDFNPKIITLYKNTGAEHTRTHVTYRYLFDRERPFVRFMPEAVDESVVPPAAREIK